MKLECLSFCLLVVLVVAGVHAVENPSVFRTLDTAASGNDHHRDTQRRVDAGESTGFLGDASNLWPQLSRKRRQAGTSRSSSRTSQTILDLRNLLVPFSVTNVAQCTDLFDNILSDCMNYVSRILTVQLLTPVQKVLDSYRLISRQCSTLPAACSVNCVTLGGTLLLVNATEADLPALVEMQVGTICSNAELSQQERFPATDALSSLGSALGALSNAANILGLLSPGCAVVQSVLPLAADLVEHGPLLTNTLSLYAALQTYTESMQLVQFVFPHRIYQAYEHLVRGDLAEPADEVYINRTISYVLCSSVYPNPSLPPCPWLCRNISELMELSSMFPQPSTNVTSPLQDLILDLSDSCVNGSSAWSLCGDVSCAPNSFCVSVPVVMQQSDLNTAQLQTVTARQRATGVCFNSTCPFPLRKTDNPKHWNQDAQDILLAAFDAANALLPELNMTYNGSVLPCGLDCVTFTFGKDDEKTAMIVVGVFSWGLFLVNGFALVTFYLNRERLNKYPTKVLLFLNITSMISNFATLIQFFTDSKSYVCFDDGTLRTNEPYDSSDHGSRTCTFLFVLLFYFLLVSLFWWLALAHAWYITFERLDTKNALPQDTSKYMKLYHVVAWTVPAILTAVALGKHYIDGFPLIGMCFTNNVNSLFALLSVPIVVVGLLGLPFLVKGSVKLLKHSASIRNMNPFRRTNKRTKRSQAGLRNFLVKLMVIMVMSFINLLVQFAVGLFMRVSWVKWREEIMDHLRCLLTRCNEEDTCPDLPHPHIFPFLLIPITIILEGFVLCLWAFTRDTWQTWKNNRSEFIRRASSLPIVRQFTGNDKPGIAGITAARKAARHLHKKASERQRAAQNGETTTSTTTGWDTTATTVFVSMSDSMRDKHLEKTALELAPMDSIDESKPSNGLAVAGDSSVRSSTRSSSRVTLNPKVEVAPIPPASRCYVDNLPSSPGKKRKDYSQTQDSVSFDDDIAVDTPKSCLKNGTSTSRSNIQVDSMASSPQSRRRAALKKLSSEYEFESPPQSPDQYSNLPESPGARRRQLNGILSPGSQVPAPSAEIRSASPLQHTSAAADVEDARGATPSSLKHAMAGSPHPLLTSQSDLAHCNTTSV